MRRKPNKPQKTCKLHRLFNLNCSRKGLSLILIFVILCLNLTGCSFRIPSLSEAKKVTAAFIHYSRTGELPDNLEEIMAEDYPDEPDISTEDFIVETGIEKALALAKKYYDLAFPYIEEDLRGDFNSIVTWEPEFDGNNVDPELCSSNSMNVAFMVTYTNAKNFYLALASAIFSTNPQDANAASNLATAIATYCDELQYENANVSKFRKDEFYDDSISMHYYALAAATANNMTDIKDTVLVNLGNLFLDANRFDQAYAAFKEALELNAKNWPAITGLYNYYMAVRQFDRALKLVAENTEAYPVFVRAVSDINKRFPEETEEPGESSEEASEAFLEKRMEELNQVPAVTAGDFVKMLDSEAAEKIEKDMEQLQVKMRFNCPNIDSLLVYQSFDVMSSVPAQAAKSTAIHFYNELAKKMLPETTESAVKKQMEMMKSLGIDLDIGFDVENLDELIKDAMRNPWKYENYKPNVNVSGTENAEQKAKDMLAGIKKGMSDSKAGEPRGIYEELAKTRPEYKIMLINPFSHNNPTDVIIQQKNIQLLSTKRLTYERYMGKVTTEPHEIIVDLLNQYREQELELSEEYDQEMKKVQDDHNKKHKELLDKLDKTTSLEQETKIFEQIEELNDDYRMNIHHLHEEYYPKFNQLAARFWSPATMAAAEAYRKIEKYVPQMYNDCMKHIMLISDEKVRDTLEDELIAKVTGYIKMGLQNAIDAYNMASPLDINACGCDEEELDEIKERKKDREKKREEAANKAIQKAMQDRANFLAGKLDENTKYYKEYIKKYEVPCNFGFVKGKISPYKSNFEFGVDAFHLGLKFKSETHHIQNTTTYDGGIKYGKKVKDTGVGLAAYLGFTGKVGSDGQFSLDDFHTRVGVEAGANLGFISFKTGIEASALRGTKEYAELAFTGDPLLDTLKKDQQIKDMIDGLPSISKTFWKGEYSEQP